MQFITHTKERITGQRLQDAINKVADDIIESANKILEQNCYASHVTEQQKIDNLNRDLKLAESVRNGNINSFWCWQRINYELTKECIGFLPNAKQEV